MRKFTFFKTAILISLLFNVVFINLNAQVTMGDTKVPENFSVLELVSNDISGLRMPQIETADDRDAISNTYGTNPKMMGLTIYNKETHCVNVWNGSKWINWCAQSKAPEEYVDIPLPANVTMYVGAFWRANQKGERLIRIPRPTTAPVNAIDGPWTATVIAGSDWITLDKQMTTDPNYAYYPTGTPNESLVHSYENSQFDALHSVNGGDFIVGGTVSAANPQIYFRIGLKSTINTANHRYGVILLTYTNGGVTATRRMWIRQGDEADYLMRYEDPINSGGLNSNTRPAAVQFLPYNTTYNPLPARVPLNNGMMTLYPTQTGAFFQWSNMNGNERIAWDPYTVAAQTGWNGVAENGYWTDVNNNPILAGTHETCPSGYRRPTDGSTYTFVGETLSVQNMLLSETRQSLFVYPVNTNAAVSMTNDAWGYYADGFFDRRTITDAPTAYPDEVYNGINSSVSIGNSNIAHVGRILFNPNSTSYASLFFPASGGRELTNNGLLYMAGFRSAYWTSSTFNGIGSGMMFIFDSNFFSVRGSLGGYAYPIRCVKR